MLSYHRDAKITCGTALTEKEGLLVQLGIHLMCMKRQKEQRLIIIPLSADKDPVPCLAVSRIEYRLNVYKCVIPADAVTFSVLKTENVSVDACLARQDVRFVFELRAIILNSQKHIPQSITARYRSKIDLALAVHFQQPRLLAFAMVFHKRLGVASSFIELDMELTLVIARMACLLGSPYCWE